MQLRNPDTNKVVLIPDYNKQESPKRPLSKRRQQQAMNEKKKELQQPSSDPQNQMTII